jgi:hypothetical protein
MANSFGIIEVTLNQLGDSTHAINTTTRKSPYQPLVARATNHVDDSGVNATTEALLTAGAAIFTQKAHGHPWLKDTGLTHLIHQAAATPAVPTNVTVLYPNFDYTTFG